MFLHALYNKYSKINRSYQAQILIIYHCLFDPVNTSGKLFLILSEGRPRENSFSSSSYGVPFVTIQNMFVLFKILNGEASEVIRVLSN